MQEYKNINWGMSYNDSEVIIKVESLKCKDVQYKEIYNCKDKDERYSEYDIKEMLKIRDNLIKKVNKEHKNLRSDVKVNIDNFVEKYSNNDRFIKIHDISNEVAEFIITHKKNLLELIERL